MDDASKAPPKYLAHFVTACEVDSPARPPSFSGTVDAILDHHRRLYSHRPSRATLRRHLKILESGGWIERTVQPRGKIGYVLTPQTLQQIARQLGLVPIAG